MAILATAIAVLITVVDVHGRRARGGRACLPGLAGALVALRALALPFLAKQVLLDEGVQLLVDLLGLVLQCSDSLLNFGVSVIMIFMSAVGAVALARLLERVQALLARGFAALQLAVDIGVDSLLVGVVGVDGALLVLIHEVLLQRLGTHRLDAELLGLLR